MGGKLLALQVAGVLLTSGCGAQPPAPHVAPVQPQASEHVRDVRLPDGIEMQLGCPHVSCVALTHPGDRLPLPAEPAAWLDVLGRFRADALRPALERLPGQTYSDVVVGCREPHAIGVSIASFDRLADYVLATSALMAHQRSPEIQICAGVTIELASRER